MLYITALLFSFFFFNDTATTEIYTLSLHDALPICAKYLALAEKEGLVPAETHDLSALRTILSTGSPLAGHSYDYVYGRIKRDVDRKSTRLNSSHSQISYAVFCLKKKKQHSSHTHDC